MRYFLALIGLVFADLLIKYSLNTAEINPITIIPLFERVFFGSVTDYLYLRIGTTPLIIFNFADLIITIGAGIMIYSWLFTNERR